MGVKNMDKEQTWSLPNDPLWVDKYLTALRAGRTEQLSCLIAGIHRDTALEWRKRDSANSARHTRARVEAVERNAADVADILREQAKKGSTWHLSRYATLISNDRWKAHNKRLKDAEPDTSRAEVSGGGAYEVVFAYDEEEQNKKADTDKTAKAAQKAK